MGELFVVPTPIGNLQDITLRAIEVLKSCDVILAEDTRQTIKLLKHFEIENSLQAFHQHNEHKVVDRYVEQLLQGGTIALVSDAGTPGISDPGFLLVREAAKHEIKITTLPGATAFVPALVNSGLPCDKFVFEGFLPHKKGRQTRIQELVKENRSVVFYESPYRLVKLLNQLAEFAGEERSVSVSREISKIHEETVRGTLKEVIQHFETGTVKGEIVVVLAADSEKK